MTQFFDYDDSEDQILDYKELKHLLANFAENRGDGGFTEDEAMKLGYWAAYVRLQSNLLDLVLKNELFIDIDENGEPVFIPKG